MRRFNYRKLSFIIAFVATLTGCFLTNILPEPKKKKKQPPTPAESPAPEESIPEPPKLSITRLVRRVSLDLTGKLPAVNDVASVKEDPNRLAELISHYLGTSDARDAVTNWHQDIWQLRPNSLPDIERYKNSGDDILKEAFANNLREKIMIEPLLRLRYILDRELAFNNLFMGNWTILHPDALELFELTEDGKPWQSLPYQFTYYKQRPEVGLLVSNALLATENNPDSEIPRHRTSRLLRRFSCTSNFQAQAHRFESLTAEELASDLDDLANFKSPCRGCHAIWSDLAESFQGLATGDDFKAWLSDQEPTATAGYWSGRRFETSAELGELIGNDPRIHQCELTRLLASLLQRPVNSYDSTLIAKTTDEFYEHSQRLLPALTAIFQSNDYGYDAVSAKAHARYSRNASGVRFLRYEHWHNLIRQFTFKPEKITLSDAIIPGAEETVTFEDRIPSGGYWYEIDRVARQLAQQIIREELVEGRIAATRQVFTMLPDGLDKNVNKTTIHQQIISLWNFLTSEDLSDINQSPLIDFVNLWEKLDKDSDEDFSLAWQVILTAMLSHPKFLTY